jgi:DNA-binding transcriptional ArsR family regulator
MTDYDHQARLFRTLMHPVRLAILDILRNGEACVCHLEALLNQRQAYISQQLMVLRRAGLIADRREGWNVYYRVVDPQVFQVLDTARLALGLAAAGLAMPANCACPKCDAGDGRAALVGAPATERLAA